MLIIQTGLINNDILFEFFFTILSFIKIEC